jgi:hypothetical protein
LAGSPIKGPWPAPVVEGIEPAVAKLAEEFPTWGHRKIWALHNLDHPGEVVSQSSVRRAMARRGLLQPVGYQCERRELAKARRAAFVEPPTHRNQVWQLDFSEFETTRDGRWQNAGCADYVTKPPSSTSPARSSGPPAASAGESWPGTHGWDPSSVSSTASDPHTSPFSQHPSRHRLCVSHPPRLAENQNQPARHIRCPSNGGQQQHPAARTHRIEPQPTIDRRPGPGALVLGPT